MPSSWPIKDRTYRVTKAIGHVLSSVVLAFCAATSSFGQDPGTAVQLSDEEMVNNGEDIINPVDRFDVRFQLKTLPDATESGETFEDRHEETFTLRSDFKFFSKPDQLALRIDLPLVWSNKPTSENRAGGTQFGLGDLLLQAAYVRTFDARWAGAIGLQTVSPTATGQAFGTGKLQLVPSAAIRASLPEISRGSYAGMTVRQFVSVAGPTCASRSTLSVSSRN